MKNISGAGQKRTGSAILLGTMSLKSPIIPYTGRYVPDRNVAGYPAIYKFIHKEQKQKPTFSHSLFNHPLFSIIKRGILGSVCQQWEFFGLFV